MTERAFQPSLTVALITKNEACNLEACLNSIKGLTDQIIIIDSGSSDETANVAARFNAKFYIHADWPGFGPQRNRAHQYIQTEWTLWLDADERLTPELCENIRHVLKDTPSDGKTLFEFNRLSNTFGKFIHHCGWYPDWVIRLYPTEHACYSNDLIHEKVLIPFGARIVKLKGNALHYTYATLEQFLIKQNLYSKIWAQQRLAQNKSATLTQAISHGLSSFIKMYFLKAGFLDGKYGFLLSILSAQSAFNKYAALWLMSKNNNASSSIGVSK